MTPEAQRIAIAEACGWVRNGKNNLWQNPYQGGGWDYLSGLPDYLNDLNAMHEAEKALMKPGLAQWCDYTRHLRRVCGIAMYAEIHATADQRAEAFLKTLNLWKD